MSILQTIEGYEHGTIKKALDMLMVDRKNEFRELAEVIFSRVPVSMGPIPNWEEFVLNFCLDVDVAFKTWSGQIELTTMSSQKALTILRQLAHDKKTMNQLTHLLNIAYTLASEFKEIYRRLS